MSEQYSMIAKVKYKYAENIFINILRHGDLYTEHTKANTGYFYTVTNRFGDLLDMSDRAYRTIESANKFAQDSARAIYSYNRSAQ